MKISKKMDAHNTLTANDLCYPLMVKDRYGSFSVEMNKDTLQTNLISFVNAEGYIGMVATDFEGRCYEVVEVFECRPIESRIAALFKMRPRMASVSLHLKRLKDKSFEEVKKKLKRAFRESSTLASMPCFDDVKEAVSQAQNFEDLTRALQPIYASKTPNV